LCQTDLPVARALKCITHVDIGAHQDDLEFMAFQGILEGYASDEKCLGGFTANRLRKTSASQSRLAATLAPPGR